MTKAQKTNIDPGSTSPSCSTSEKKKERGRTSTTAADKPHTATSTTILSRVKKTKETTTKASTQTKTRAKANAKAKAKKTKVVSKETCATSEVMEQCPHGAVTAVVGSATETAGVSSGATCLQVRRSMHTPDDHPGEVLDTNTNTDADTDGIGDMVSEAECANFGVSSCCNAPAETMNLILHLKVHSAQDKQRSRNKGPGNAEVSTTTSGCTSQRPVKTLPGTTSVSAAGASGTHTCTSPGGGGRSGAVPDPANGSSSHQVPYAELLSYSPTLGTEPVAYEPTGTDSAPCTLPGSEQARKTTTSSATCCRSSSSGDDSDCPRDTPATSTKTEAQASCSVVAGHCCDGDGSDTPGQGKSNAGHGHLGIEDNGTRKSVGSAHPAASYNVFHVQNNNQPAVLDGICHVPDGSCSESPSSARGGKYTDTTPYRSTDTSCCWWCTLPFNWPSYSMPIQHYSKDKKYSTLGVFCSPECCAAYVFDNAGRYGDSWKQYEMLHRMVHKMIDNKRVRIKLAPPRETLRKYGGTYTDEDYRELVNNYRTEVRMVMPPVFPVQTVIEETPADYNKPTKKFVPIDATRVERATNELRLKRKKKQSSENTLETFMRLRVSA